MNPDLRAILKEGSHKDNDSYTHITYNPKTNWNIRSSFLTEFWKRYCMLVDNSAPDLNLHEKSNNRTPVLLIFNFQFQNNGNIDTENPFNDLFILHLVSSFQHVLFSIMRIPDNLRSKTLRACYLESETTFDANIANCRIRIQFPYCKTDISIQQKKIIPELIKTLRMDNVIGFLGQQPLNDWNDI